ncbi:MAG: DNA-protecting protein DprA [Crocinitomicaceae bacterium]|nr:DNA-protecting protein DprA [Crocinitomicaceae bacterium]
MIFEMYFFLNLKSQNYKTLRKLNDLYKIAASKLHGIGPVRTQQILSKIGDVEELFSNSLKSIWLQSGFSQSILKSLNRDEALKLADTQLNFNIKNNVSTHFFLDGNYPRRLKQCNDSPIVVYSKGKMDLNHSKIVSIVGTRDLTSYGQRILIELIHSLKEEGVLVASGLAYGVDILAHQLCVENDIQTIGVLGHGLDRIYPFKHRGIAKEMLENGGLVTEFMINTKPDRENFPMRNRIIAGLSDGVLVVETAERGGSMITAQLANDYNREVMALPGRITDKWSQGCLKLIKNQEASLVSGSEDITRILQWKESNAKQMIIPFLEPLEKKIVDLYVDAKSISLEYLLLHSSLSIGSLSQLLLDMEFKGLLKELPGKRYQKLI